jgi:two-component system chemotaxis sensor kinase CheA
MAAEENPHQKLEEIVNRLASEVVFAKAGSDEGLIPAYALLTDLVEAAAEEADLLEAGKEAVARLESYLDDAKPFDEELIAYLHTLVTWMPSWVEARLTGQPLPARFALEVPAEDAPVEATGGVAAKSVEMSTVDQMLQLNLDENRELLAEFHSEALDHLDTIEAGLLALDDNPEDRDGIDSLFRSFHTLKGNAGFLHLVPMQLLCHEVESLLDLARSDKLVLAPDIVTAILQSRDAVQAMLDQVYNGLEHDEEPNAVIPVSHLIAEVARLAELHAGTSGTPKAAPAPTPAPVAAPTAVSAAVAVAVADSGSADAPAEPVAAAPVEAKPAASPDGEPGGLTTANVLAQAAESMATAARHASTVRVSTQKLDLLMDVVGELVIVQGQILATASQQHLHAVGRSEEDHVIDEAHERNINQLSRITKDLQHTAMALRMVPIKPTFQKMERLVRDLAHRMGKKVSMTVHGEETEVDRTVVEEISDPLVHMIRNALDHGVEGEADRVAAGKEATGKLCLRAYHQGGSIVIELQDDGRGIDSDKVLKKAREKGIVGPDQSLTESEVLGLIFAAGFSTAAAVTDVSGRGVGMDVVRRNIERLRGTIEVKTEMGKGSTFRIRLPLTMAIIDGLILRVGGDRFVLPTTAVKMALRPVKKDLVRVQGRGEVLDHRGKLLPLVRLHEKFGISDAQSDPTQGMVVLIEHSGRTSALLVDEMEKKQEVVIKNLGGFFGSIAGIAGGAILGDGNIALILDPPALMTAA